MVFLTALIDGLQASLVKNTLTTQAHVVIRPPRRRRAWSRRGGARWPRGSRSATSAIRTLDQWPLVLATGHPVPGVEAAAVTVAGSGFADAGQREPGPSRCGASIRTVQGSSPSATRMQSGASASWATRRWGRRVQLAQDLGIRVGDKIRLGTGDGRTDAFVVAGVFDLGNKDVNQRWVFVSIRAAQTLLQIGRDVSTIELRVAEPFQAEAIAREVGARTGMVSESWMTLNRQLLVALSSQSSSSYMIQFFVVLAVALGIASVLAVSVVHKSREIGILRATGTSTRSIMGIFLVQGGIVGVVGAVSGCLLGTALALFFAGLATSPDGSPTFPVRLDAALMLTASAIAVAVGLLSAVIPARRAAQLDPATVIHGG
jgi:lipoprotein-releasing system permease protein